MNQAPAMSEQNFFKSQNCQMALIFCDYLHTSHEHRFKKNAGMLLQPARIPFLPTNLVNLR
jgi:hypothetical protein